MDPKLSAYVDLLFKWNRAVRLTAFETKEEAHSMGVLPSLAIADEIGREGTLLDVGSGGGFPAIPLAIARPDLRVTCTEPSLQKAAFLREMAVQLDLNLSVETCPAEMLLRRSQVRWDAVTVRGVHLRHGLLKRMASSLAPGGLMAIWSGGEREQSYAKWASEAGLLVERQVLPTFPPVSLLLARVPRGTSSRSTPETVPSP